MRRTWFGQFNELYFVLNWLMIRCKLRPELAAEAQQTASSKMQAKVKSSSQYTLIILHRVIQLTNISFWVPETRLRLPQETNKQISPEASEVPSDTIILLFIFIFYLFFIFYFLPHPQESSPLSVNQRQCSSNRANIPRTC